MNGLNAPIDKLTKPIEQQAWLDAGTLWRKHDHAVTVDTRDLQVDRLRPLSCVPGRSSVERSLAILIAQSPVLPSMIET